MNKKKILKFLKIDKTTEKLLKVKVEKIKGVIFVYKAIGIVDYFDSIGYPIQLNAEAQELKFKEKYLAKKGITPDELIKMYTPIFLKGILHPKFSLKPQENEMDVKELFVDWELATILYKKITDNSFKKKTYKLFLKKRFLK